MSNKLIHNKKDILGAIFLADQIKNDPIHTPLFEEGETSAYDELESYTLLYRKVSKTSFRRFFNLINDPWISLGTLNNIVLWYTNRKYANFKRYVEGNRGEIESSNIISEEQLEKLVIKAKDGNPKNKTKEAELEKKENKKYDKRRSINDETKEEETNKSEQPIFITIQNVVKNKPYYFIGAFGIIIVAIVISAFYFDHQKSRQPNTKIDQINITNNDFREIFPTKESDFFSPQGEPIVWYAHNGSELDFFNQSGNHPITQKPLKLVSREIVNNHLKEEVKINRPAKVTQKTSVNILHDRTLDDRISSYFKNNYTLSTPYQCKGQVTYEFTRSSLNEKLILCDLTLSYTVFSDNEEIESRFI